MAKGSWTREENKKFKIALQLFSAFSCTRFENISEYVKKPVAEAKEHYEKMVHELLEMGSNQIALPEELTGEIPLEKVRKTRWIREEHEWFLMGLFRFGKKWNEIAFLLKSKNSTQVEMYAENYFQWQNDEMKEPGTSDDIVMVDLMGQDENLVQQQWQPPQEQNLMDGDW